MRFQMLAFMLLSVSLLCAEEIHGASLAEGSESQDWQEGGGESKVMVKREVKPQSVAGCRFCCGCCPGMIGCGLCCNF